ncbi:hypothetical protein [Nitratifractor sp.]
MIDANTARHILRKVPYDEGIDMAVLFPPKSLARKRVRSLKELERVLEPQERMIPSIRFDRLVAWIGEVLGDRELSARLEAVAREEGVSYLQRCVAIHSRIRMRCRQLESAAEEGSDG